MGIAADRGLRTRLGTLPSNRTQSRSRTQILVHFNWLGCALCAVRCALCAVDAGAFACADGRCERTTHTVGVTYGASICTDETTTTTSMMMMMMMMMLSH
eukprot:COSAG06_NODE_1492_length_9279_cov_835.540632_2_plen_100_part_00